MVTIIATGFNKKAILINTHVEQSEMVFNDKTPENGYSSNKGRISTMPSHEELRRFDEPAYTRRQVELADDLSEKKKKIMPDPDDDLDFNEISQNYDFDKPAFLRRSAD